MFYKFTTLDYNGSYSRANQSVKILSQNLLTNIYIFVLDYKIFSIKSDKYQLKKIYKWV